VRPQGDALLGLKAPEAPVTYETLKLCSGRSAFEAVPNPRLTLDLAAIRDRLRAEGIEVVDARVMLIAQLEKEVTLGRDGRVLIKSADPKEADVLFQRLDRIAGLTSKPGHP
jgi:hypothetical protein